MKPSAPLREVYAPQVRKHIPVPPSGGPLWQQVRPAQQWVVEQFSLTEAQLPPAPAAPPSPL